MTDWIVIPFRGPEGAKSRLAPALDEAGRRVLTVAMFERVLAATVECRGTSGATDVLVVTPSSTAAAIARSAGARVLMEQTGSLNAALELARDFLRGEGPGAMTVIAADLPDVAAADIAAIMHARNDGVAIAPDHTGQGTNAISVALDCDLPFRFGIGSLTAHTAAAQRLALPVAVVSRPGLARDIDVPTDLPLDKDLTNAR